jgi:hypothetical protein
MVTNFIVSQAFQIPQCPEEATACLITVALLTNLGISYGTLYRLWPYEPQVHGYSGPLIRPSEIRGKLVEVGTSLMRSIGIGDTEQRLQTIAQVEWQLGIGPLHPFYDGCGRISRYFSAIIACWQEVPLVYHRSRVEYMGHASDGITAFTEYF